LFILSAARLLVIFENRITGAGYIARPGCQSKQINLVLNPEIGMSWESRLIFILGCGFQQKSLPDPAGFSGLRFDRWL